MYEYIKKDELLKFKADVYDEDEHLLYAVPTGCIVAMPPADVAPVRHGRWMDNEDYMFCSCCGMQWNYCDNDTEDFHYCPNCGAKMDLHDECEQEVER